jgi:hypothetical protein
VIVPIEVFTPSGVTISSFTSSDGGQAWSTTHLIAEADLHTSAGNIRNGGALPSARTDDTGRVYVTWSDCRFEPGCKANDIVLSTSDDGATWTSPERIPIDPVRSMVDHFTPGLGVDPLTSGAHAHLALGYYYYPQAKCTTATCQLDVGYISSIDGGKSWSQPVHVAGPMTLTWLAPTSSGPMAGATWPPRSCRAPRRRSRCSPMPSRPPGRCCTKTCTPRSSRSPAVTRPPAPGRPGPRAAGTVSSPAQDHLLNHGGKARTVTRKRRQVTTRANKEPGLSPPGLSAAGTRR